MNNELKNLILSSSSITGSSVKNLKDEKVGEIKDLMIDTESGEVAYAVLSVNTGFLNLESKYFAIPFQAFTFHSHRDEVLTLDIDKERLKDSPGFDKDNWPKGPQREFIDEVNAFYGIDRNRTMSDSTGMHSNERLDRGTL